jgi:hypothetical protein
MAANSKRKLEQGYSSRASSRNLPELMTCLHTTLRSSRSASKTILLPPLVRFQITAALFATVNPQTSLIFYGYHCRRVIVLVLTQRASRPPVTPTITTASTREHPQAVGIGANQLGHGRRRPANRAVVAEPASNVSASFLSTPGGGFVTSFPTTMASAFSTGSRSIAATLAFQQQNTRDINCAANLSGMSRNGEPSERSGQSDCRNRQHDRLVLPVVRTERIGHKGE